MVDLLIQLHGLMRGCKDLQGSYPRSRGWNAMFVVERHATAIPPPCGSQREEEQYNKISDIYSGETRFVCSSRIHVQRTAYGLKTSDGRPRQGGHGKEISPDKVRGFMVCEACSDEECALRRAVQTYSCTKPGHI